MPAPLLDVKGLETQFKTPDGIIHAVNGVSFSLEEGETLGLVGESGCGKSVTMLSVLRLIAMPPGKIVAGEAFFHGQDLLKMSQEEIRNVRGAQIAMVFQDPMTSLNPVLTIGYQLEEPLMLHLGMNRNQAQARSTELLAMVGIPNPKDHLQDYPHQFSGGMRQRVMIAMALSCDPQILIADEPTTALDVTIQAQILDLIRDLRNKVGASVILITHDLGVIAEMAERVAVMYAGRIVEQADVRTLFANPRHPYTQGLMGSIPILGKTKERLEVIPGTVPNLVNLPPGCRFAPRCKARIEHQLQICTEVEPDLIPISSEHLVRCWLYQDQEGHHAPLK
jgi:oligopeptide/dipeptide ABC transporter ATP-binding protein